MLIEILLGIGSDARALIEVAKKLRGSISDIIGIDSYLISLVGNFYSWLLIVT